MLKKGVRKILIFWLFATFIISNLFKNEILASLMAKRTLLVDSLEDLKDRQLKAFVPDGSSQHKDLISTYKENCNQDCEKYIEKITWPELWSVHTMGKVLAGTHVIVYTEEKLVTLFELYKKYPLHLSDTREQLTVGAFLMRKDIEPETKQKIQML